MNAAVGKDLESHRHRAGGNDMEPGEPADEAEAAARQRAGVRLADGATHAEAAARAGATAAVDGPGFEGEGLGKAGDASTCRKQTGERNPPPCPSGLPGFPIAERFR